MTKDAAQKYLKNRYRSILWLVIAANCVVFYSVLQSETVAVTGWKGLFTGAASLVPAGFALIATSIANGLVSANMKARLVFLRWNNALPGTRAFSKLAPADPRIDLERLKQSIGGEFPDSPEAENKVWYRVFKEVESAPEVENAHRDFLFFRDYANLSALFFVGLGSSALVLMPTWQIALTYCLALLAQFFVVRHVAVNYGERFVCTVLAVKSAQQTE